MRLIPYSPSFRYMNSVFSVEEIVSQIRYKNRGIPVFCFCFTDKIKFKSINIKLLIIPSKYHTLPKNKGTPFPVCSIKEKAVRNSSTKRATFHIQKKRSSGFRMGESQTMLKNVVQVYFL